MNILFALFSENMNYYFLYIFIWPFYSNIFANDVIMFPSYKNIFLHNHRQFQSKERIKRPLMENQMNFAPSNNLLYGENNKRRKLESNSELPFENRRSVFERIQNWGHNFPKQIIENECLPKHLMEKERSKICTSRNAADPICRHFEEFGWPIEDLLIWKEDFFINFNQRTRLANWVLEQINPQSVRHNEKVNRQKMRFHTEQQLNRMFAVREMDYKSLYSQKSMQMNHGHLAPALDHWSDENKMFATFSLANIAPQSKILNSGAWNWLEKRTRQAVLNGNKRRSFSSSKRFNNGRYLNPKISQNIATSHVNSYFFPDEKIAYICPGPCPNAFIYTGPLFWPKNEDDKYVEYKTVGEHQMAIPSHFFKAIFIQTPNGIHNENYVLPNEDMKEEYFLQNHNLFKISLNELGFELMNENIFLQNGQHLPSTIHQFWEQFGHPVDHQIERSGNTVYSCNGHLNLLNWKLDFLNSRKNLQNVIIFNELNNAKCQPNIDMGKIGREIDNEIRKLISKTGADVFLYSGPLFPANNEGIIQYRIEINENGEEIAIPESFFKIRILIKEKIQIDSFIFPKIASGNLEDYKVKLEEIERISGIQLMPKKIGEFLNGNGHENIAKMGNRMRTWRRIFKRI